MRFQHAAAAAIIVTLFTCTEQPEFPADPASGAPGSPTTPVRASQIQRPEASFEYRCKSLRCDFLSTSTDDDPDPLMHAWDFGDGNRNDFGPDSVRHFYDEKGTYEVTLTVTDAEGESDSATESVTVTTRSDNEPPVADFYWDSTHHPSYTFISTSTDDVDETEELRHRWSLSIDDMVFDVGSRKHEFTHRFTNPNWSYHIGLEVTDTDGASDLESKGLTVRNYPPVAGFEYECEFKSCTFTSGSTDDFDDISELDHRWLFGDGNEGSGKEVSHTYEDAGTYEVTLMVTDSEEESDSVTDSVKVNQRLELKVEIQFTHVTHGIQHHNDDGYGDPVPWITRRQGRVLAFVTSEPACLEPLCPGIRARANLYDSTDALLFRTDFEASTIDEISHDVDTADLGEASGTPHFDIWMLSENNVESLPSGIRVEVEIDSLDAVDNGIVFKKGSVLRYSSDHRTENVGGMELRIYWLGRDTLLDGDGDIYRWLEEIEDNGAEHHDIRRFTNLLPISGLTVKVVYDGFKSGYPRQQTDDRAIGEWERILESFEQYWNDLLDPEDKELNIYHYGVVPEAFPGSKIAGLAYVSEDDSHRRVSLGIPRNPYIMAHEVGHNMSMNHVSSSCGLNDWDNDEVDYPDSSGSIIAWGYASMETASWFLSPHDPPPDGNGHFDIMTNCLLSYPSHIWVSDYTMKKTLGYRQRSEPNN